MSGGAGTMIKAAYFFFNAVFAFCAALVVHECGHAVFVKMVHGYYPQISMNPLAGGYVSYYSAPATAGERLLISSGGILVGSLTGITAAVAGLAWWRSAWSAPAILFGIVSLCVNALMLTVGYVIFETGDLHRMVAAGFSPWLAAVLGAGGLMLGGYFMARALPRFGLDHHAPLIEKYIVLVSGVLLYGAFVLLATVLGDDAQHLPRKVKYVTVTVTVLVAGLWVVDAAARRLPDAPAGRYAVTGRHVAVSALLAAAAFGLTIR